MSSVPIPKACGLPPISTSASVFFAIYAHGGTCTATVSRRRLPLTKRLFGKLRRLANDVGLYAEEYDPGERRMLGNFPQAFSHIALINTALNLMMDARKKKDRIRRRGRR